MESNIIKRRDLELKAFATEIVKGMVSNPNVKFDYRGETLYFILNENRTNVANVVSSIMKGIRNSTIE